MINIQERESIKEEFKWDLSSLYISDNEWEVEIKRINGLIEEIVEYKTHILDNDKNLQRTIELSLKLDRVLSNLYTYAKMKQDENTKKEIYQNMTSRAESIAVKANQETAFIVTELLEDENDLINKYICDNKKLVIYIKYFDDLLRKKKHVLSEKEEVLLAQAGEMAAVAQNSFGMLNNADLKFPKVALNDEIVNLSHGNFVPLLESANRTLRKEVFQKYYEVYENHKNVFASMLAGNIKKNIFYSKARNFNSSIESALFENNIPLSVYDNLIEAVNENLPAMHKYMKLRKKVLKLDKLQMYDIYTPIVEDVEIKFDYNESQQIVLEALKPLGDEYTRVVENSFKDGWIDVYENVGKRSGAYSWGTYDSKPYILLNYHQTLDNTFTLIHEMGHSMHSYLTRKTQPYVYGNYSIFVAEVASTTNEALLNQYLLKKETDPKKKLFILNHYLEQFRGTVYRQTMFAEFEKLIYEMSEAGEALTADVLSEKYVELNKKYYGPEVVIDDKIALEWARIPHFYYNFYVYQYATGFSAAIALSQRILNEGDCAVEDYLKFLKSGNSKDSIEILERAGANMLSKEPVENTLKLFDELVDEFERLLIQEK